MILTSSTQLWTFQMFKVEFIRLFFLRAIDMIRAIVLLFCISIFICSKAYAKSKHRNKPSSKPSKEFQVVIGDGTHPSRRAFYDYIDSAQIKDILDVGCGVCLDGQALKREFCDIRYIGIDIDANKLLSARGHGFNVILGDINSLKFSENYFECVYSRYVLDILPYYQSALFEMMRIASKEVIVTFRNPPQQEGEIIQQKQCKGQPIWDNHYNRTRLQQFIDNNPKVISTYWQSVVDSSDVILHIHLKIER
jgi:ubiquinone/menaquinone biosynthesis C-methylase UbiE